MSVVLKVDSISKRYGDVIALDSVSFTVRQGEIFGLLGPNGAGKTTLINIMTGLLSPDSGSIATNIADRKSIGVCPQDIVIWENLTCREQLVYMGNMYDMTAREANRQTDDLLESLGLINKRNKLARTLSGGMQRRMNIALALIHSPEIVFLDEPQAGLDPQSRVLVRDYIKSIKDKMTVILTTHDMEEAEKLSDRICIIDHGKLLTIGTTEEIKIESGQEDLIQIDIRGNIQNELVPYLNNNLQDYIITSENSARFKITDPYETLTAILEVIKERDIKIDNLQLRKRSLEDVFIYLTGRSIRE